MPTLRIVLLVVAASCGESSTPAPKAAGAAAETYPTLASQLTSSATKGMPVSPVRLPARPKWQRIPAPPEAHPLICDMAWFQDALWVSFGTRTISVDGAQIYSYRPDRGWKIELDWDRGGKPNRTHEQGGQGIPRLWVEGETLYATDADAPNFGGFGLSPAPFEGYIFRAGPEGFSPLGPGLLPPEGTLVVPFAFHVFDVVRFAGKLVASGGSISANRKSRFPGALFVEDEEAKVLIPHFFPGDGEGAGVVRATFLHEFAGRLYVGFQNNERRARWDLGVIESLEGPLVLGRVTPTGGHVTKRFASSRDRLYWIAKEAASGGKQRLFHSADGLSFTPIDLGDQTPQDVIVSVDGPLVLTSSTLGIAHPRGFKEIAPRQADQPFASRDTFCSAPLEATPLGIFAGSSTSRGLYLLAPSS